MYDAARAVQCARCPARHRPQDADRERPTATPRASSLQRERQPLSTSTAWGRIREGFALRRRPPLYQNGGFQSPAGMIRRRVESVWEHRARAIGIQQTLRDVGVVVERMVSFLDRDYSVIVKLF